MFGQGSTQLALHPRVWTGSSLAKVWTNFLLLFMLWFVGKTYCRFIFVLLCLLWFVYGLACSYISLQNHPKIDNIFGLLHMSCCATVTALAVMLSGLMYTSHCARAITSWLSCFEHGCQWVPLQLTVIFPLVTTTTTTTTGAGQQ